MHTAFLHADIDQDVFAETPDGSELCEDEIPFVCVQNLRSETRPSLTPNEPRLLSALGSFPNFGTITEHGNIYTKYTATTLKQNQNGLLSVVV